MLNSSSILTVVAVCDGHGVGVFDDVPAGPGKVPLVLFPAGVFVGVAGVSGVLVVVGVCVAAGAGVAYQD
jgi:hypothetical protein